MPGGGGHQQAERIRQALRHRLRLFRRHVLGGKRADRAAELQHRAVEQRGAQMAAAARERIQPAGGLPAEGDRRGRLQERAPDHHRGAMGIDQRAQRSAGALEGIEQAAAGLLALHCQRRVDDVLAGAAVMQIAHRPRIEEGDLLAERLQEGDHQRARIAGGGIESAWIEAAVGEFRRAAVGG
jgi:hypothetical protein